MILLLLLSTCLGLTLRVTPSDTKSSNTRKNLKKSKTIPAAAVYFSLDAFSGLLATASASAPAIFLDSALCSCGVL